MIRSVEVQSEALSAPLMHTIGQFCVFHNGHSVSVKHLSIPRAVTFNECKNKSIDLI